jgi:very-short-patch-repair endonuclease
MTEQLPGPRRRRHQTPAELWAREEAAAKRRELEDRLAFQIKALGLPLPLREFRFDKIRLWRFDFAWPDFGLAVEVEGAVWTGGRHTRGAGFEHDVDKYNSAACLGWQVLRFTATHVRTGAAVRRIEDALTAAAAARR